MKIVKIEIKMLSLQKEKDPSKYICMILGLIYCSLRTLEFNLSEEKETKGKHL